MGNYERKEAWRNGFESGLELCVAELSSAADQEAAVKKVKKYLELVKKDKLENIKEMLSYVI